jgi:hypothetical protein
MIFALGENPIGITLMSDGPLAAIDEFTPLDKEPIWPEHWWYLKDEEKLREGLQRELHAELSDAHPLCGLRPVVVARCERNDDILVNLADGRLAFVHLVWHGHVDQYPDKFPWTFIPDSWEQLQQELNGDE